MYNNNTDIERIVVTKGRTTHRTRAGNKRITGLCIVYDNSSHALDVATLQISIDKKEIFPADFNPCLLICDPSVNVNKRFYKFINHNIDQSDIDVVSDATATFSLLLQCEQDG